MALKKSRHLHAAIPQCQWISGSGVDQRSVKNLGKYPRKAHHFMDHRRRYIETTLTHINYSNWIAFVCNWVALAYFDCSNWVDQQLLESWTTHCRQLTCDGQILETVSSSAQTSSHHRWFATLESFWQTQKPTTGISVHTNHVAQQTAPSSSAEDCANKSLLISLQILVMAFDPVKIIAIKMR